MDTTVKALQNLYAALGGDIDDVKNLVTIPDMINAIAAYEIKAVTVEAEAQNKKIFGVNVSSLQSADTAVANNAVTGTLANITSGVLARDWGAGHFAALKFSADDWNAFDSVKVGLSPSAGSGLVEILNDPDKNGVFKITDKDAQKFVVEITVGGLTKTQEYDLSGLTLDT